MRALRLVPALGVLLALAALATPAAARLRIGVQDDGQVITNPALAIARAHALGARDFRIIVRADRDPLSAYDPAIQLAHAARMRVIVSLWGYTSTRVEREAARRWAPLVHVWSPWNEPDLAGMTPGRYRQVFSQLRAAVVENTPRRARHKIRILAGDVSPIRGVEFMRKIGRLRGAAGVAVHPYEFEPWAGSIAHVRRFRKFGPVYVDEFGEWGPGRRGARGTSADAYHSGTPGTPGATSSRDLSLREAARRMRRALRFARRAHARDFVAYQVSTDRTAAWDTGLLNPDGTPRPVWWTIRKAAA